MPDHIHFTWCVCGTFIQRVPRVLMITTPQYQFLGVFGLPRHQPFVPGRAVVAVLAAATTRS